MKTNRNKTVLTHSPGSSLNPRRSSLVKLLAVTLGASALLSLGAFRAEAASYALTNGNFLETFADVANWTANFAAGGGASNWASVAINATGTIPDGQRITVSSATFSTGTSGGVQKGTNNLVLLTTGTPDGSAADAVDLILDCTGTNAGALTFDYLQIGNSTGNRASSIRVYTSINGTTWTELTAAAVLNLANNVAASGTIGPVVLPASFTNTPTARIRFYEYNGTGGTTGSRAKIAIDNVAVTAGTVVIAPSITQQPVGATVFKGAPASFSVVAGGTLPLSYQWLLDGTNVSNGGAISGANTNLLSISAADFTNASAYTVVVSNAGGSATSTPPAILVVTNPVPVLLSQPQSQTNLYGTVASFSVSVYAAPPISYFWSRYGTNLADGGNISGSGTATLTVSNLSAADATDYIVVVTNNAGANTSSPPASLVLVSSGVLAQWDFNAIGINVASPAPSVGSAAATATSVGTTNTFVTSSPNGGPSDPIISVLGATNYYWGSSTYPTNGNPANNKSTGLQFKVSTLGLRNLVLSYDNRASAGGTKYARMQYTTNGTDFVDFPVTSTLSNAPNWEVKRNFSLLGFPGVRSNANFAVRVVAELENTATYGVIANTNYVGAGGAYSVSGTFSVDMVALTAETITNGNTPPVISSRTNFTMLDTVSSTNLVFTISDAQSAPNLLTVAAIAYNPAGKSILSSSINNNNDGTATLQLTPTIDQDGVVPIIVTVTDPDGDSAATWLYVTVNPGNKAPTITSSFLHDTNMLMNTSLALPFAIGDDATPVNSLAVTVTSGDSTLLTNVTFSPATGTNRTLTIIPNTNSVGATPITLSVTDDAVPPKTTTLTFVLIVRASTNVVMNDLFDYDGSGALTGVSGGLWINHSGSGAVSVGSGVAGVTDGNGEDVHALLIGQPYATNSGVTLYSSFTANFSALPSAGGTYLAHFMDAQTGAATGFGARLWVSTSNAAAGFFRAGIGNGQGATAANIIQVPQDLQLGSNYTFVTRFVIGTGVATLWVDPVAETGGATATDVSTSPDVVVNSIVVIGYAFRQAAGEGTLSVDNLKVGKTFGSVVSVVAPIPLYINLAGPNAVLTWSNSVFSLGSSTNVAGPYAKIPLATSPYTNAATGTLFFRLIYP